MGGRPWTASAATAAIFAAAGLTGCEGSAERPSGPALDSAAATVPVEAPAADSVAVRRGDFRISLTLAGSVVAGDSVPVVPARGLRVTDAVKDGVRVRAGQPVGDIRVDPDLAHQLEAGGSGPDRSRLALLRVREGRAVAPVAGVVASTDASAGQLVIDAPGLDVVAPVSPVQALRLDLIPFTASVQVETTLGQRAFDCERAWIDTPVDLGSDPAAGSGPQLRCRLPQRAETGDGLPAQLRVTSETLSDVLLVPNVFVGYDEAADAYEVTVRDRGKKSTVPVTVGPTDGVVRVITSELPVGAELVLPQGADG